MWWIVRERGGRIEYYMGGSRWSDSEYQARVYDDDTVDAILVAMDRTAYKIMAD